MRLFKDFVGSAVVKCSRDELKVNEHEHLSILLCAKREIIIIMGGGRGRRECDEPNGRY